MRALIAAALAAAKLFETGELEERIAALELATAATQVDRAVGGSDAGLLAG